jgi:hypothetical protein
MVHGTITLVESDLHGVLRSKYRPEQRGVNDSGEVRCDETGDMCAAFP